MNDLDSIRDYWVMIYSQFWWRLRLYKISSNLTLYFEGTQKSYENILSSGRAYSISSISAERIKGILDDKLCIYGYQTGKTPRTSDFHELDDIPENQLHTLSYYKNNKQLKVSHKTSARPKSAGDAHIGINSVSIMLNFYTSPITLECHLQLSKELRIYCF